MAVTGTLALAPAAHAADPVTVNATPSFLEQDTTAQTVADFTIVEGAAGAIDTGHLHINVVGPPTVNIDTAPTVTETTSTDLAVGTVTKSGNDIDVEITAKSTGPQKATLRVRGLKLTTIGHDDANLGDVTVKIGSTAGGTEYAAATKVAFVGHVDRLFGSTRYATAAAIARETNSCDGSKTYILARGDNFADALAASYLSRINGAPILLTATNSLPNETIGALKDLGVQHLDIIGGTQAISSGVENLIKATHAFNCDTPTQHQLTDTISVNRVQGTDRYETAKAVVTQGGGTVGLLEKGLDDACTDQVKTAIVASGVNFPDALSAGPLAYSGSAGGGCGDGNPLPMLLTDTNSLPSATSGELLDLGVKQVILMGGTTAVSNSVETSLKNIGGTNNIKVVRVFGNTRQETAAALADRILDPGTGAKYRGRTVLISRPDDFADALAAAPYAGHNGFPLLLAASTSSLGSPAANEIKGFDSDGTFDFFRGRALGGTTALADSVLPQIEAALATQTEGP
jgi:putative cell wall-binding protein